MKNHLTSFALCALLGAAMVFASPVAQDQSAPAPQGSAGQHSGRFQQDPSKQVARLAKRLNLSDDQQKQILPIFSDRQQQMAAIMSDSSLAPKDRRSKLKAVREDSEGKVKAVLSDAQKQQYDQLVQEMKEHERQRKDQPKS